MTVPFTTIDKLYINGEWIDSGPEREDVINPATETVIGRAPVGTAAAADAAIAAARTAFDDGPWPTMSMAERAAILRRMHRSEEHTSELQSLMRIPSSALCLK